MHIIYVCLILFAFFSLALFRHVALSQGLVDVPGARKQHQGKVPLIGGISLYFTLCFYLLLTNHELNNPLLYLLCITILLIVGIVDDKYDVRAWKRFTIQGVVACIMIVNGDLYLSSLGGIIGYGELWLGYPGYLITFLAVWGAVNAFNMIDGIDGLLGGLSIIAFGTIGILVYVDGQLPIAHWCLAIIVALIPYLMANLGLLGQKYRVFMGDSGSTLLGFTIIWILLESTQGEGIPLRPVTALWIITIPLMDMAVTMIRRVKSGRSPFSADREHLHYILMRQGFSAKTTLVIILSAASIFSLFGIFGESLAFVKDWHMFVLFIFLFISYFLFISNADRLFARFRNKTAVVDIKN